MFGKNYGGYSGRKCGRKSKRKGNQKYILKYVDNPKWGKRRKYRKAVLPLCVMAAVMLFALAGWGILTIARNHEGESVEAWSQDVLTNLEDAEEKVREAEDTGNGEEDAAAGGLADAAGPDGRRTGDIKVKGIYVTGPMAGNEAFQELLELVDGTELNTMVIDVKNDEGKISWQMDLESARSLGACTPYIGDIGSFMRTLEEHGIYTIARIVCFKDPCLAAGKPELALKKADGTPVTDGGGMAWVNPYREEVWEYLTKVAETSVEAGFDEIQFDYVRFPIGEDAEAAEYGVDMGETEKQQAIGGFLEYAVNRYPEDGLLPN